MTKRVVIRSAVVTRWIRAAASAAVFVCALACEVERPAPVKPVRIVTLAPNLTEMMFAVGAGPSVAGTDDASNYPPSARALPKVGAMQPDIEKIAALKPDLVLASTEGNHPNLAQALKAVNVPLLLIKTDRLAEIAPAMRTLGERANGSRTNEAVATLERELAAQKRTRAKAPRVLFAVWTDPLYVAGRNTFIDDLFLHTGATNAVPANGWPQYSLESLVANPPDLILYPRGAVTPQQIEALLARAPGMRARVEPVDQDIFQRPGPRVAEAARALNAILDRQ
jgi:iron complex transport system substrate-binding protein